MTRYRLVYAEHLGSFENATTAILAGLLAGLSGEMLTWIPVAPSTTNRSAA